MKGKKLSAKVMPTLTYQQTLRNNPDRPSNNPLYPELRVKERAYETPDDMAAKMQEYFEWCADYTEEVMSATGQIKELLRPIVPTVEQLAAYIGISRRTLQDYAKRPEFSYLIEQVSEFILGGKMSALINGKGSAAGLIFDLTNNYGMKNAWESKEERTLRVVYEDDTNRAALPRSEEFRPTEEPQSEAS